MKCVEKNSDLVNKYLEDLDNEKGSFSQQGMWKLKYKLYQRSLDPSMYKLDSNLEKVLKNLKTKGDVYGGVFH